MVALWPAWIVSGSAENASCTGKTLIAALEAAWAHEALVTVATYVVVWLTGNVAEPPGKVSCRSSASGSAGENVMATALEVVHVSVTSCPATTVPVLAVSEIVGAGAGAGGGTVGLGGGAGTGVGGPGSGGRDCVGVPPPPASCDIALEPVPPQPAHSATQRIAVKVTAKLRS